MSINIIQRHKPEYLKHCCQPCNLCLVGYDPIYVKRMSGNSLSRLTGHISPGQCSAPSRPPGSPRSWWRCPCTLRRGRHIMFRDVVKYCFEASLCLSCFSAEDTMLTAELTVGVGVWYLSFMMMTFDFLLNLFLDVLFKVFLLDDLLCALLDLAL